MSKMSLIIEINVVRARKYRENKFRPLVKIVLNKRLTSITKF